LGEQEPAPVCLTVYVQYSYSTLVRVHTMCDACAMHVRCMWPCSALHAHTTLQSDSTCRSQLQLGPKPPRNMEDSPWVMVNND